MGQKDMAEKLLEDYNDVFADIINVLLFSGKQIVSPKELKDSKIKSQYKADDSNLHQLERDVAKIWRESSIQLAIYGLENQTKAEKYMPLRIIGYDGISYRQQLLEENKKNPKMPVITVVLYFGKSHWNYPKTIKELIPIPEELEPFVNDYKMNVFEIAWLSDEQVSMFQSDFKIIADFFVQKRKNKEYVPSGDTITHVDEFLKFMEVMTGDNKYDITFSNKDMERGVSMCDVVKQFEKKGIAIGEAIGEANNLLDNLAKLQKNLKISLEDALKILDKTMNDYDNALKLTK